MAGADGRSGLAGSCPERARHSGSFSEFPPLSEGWPGKILYGPESAPEAPTGNIFFRPLPAPERGRGREKAPRPSTKPKFPGAKPHKWLKLR